MVRSFDYLTVGAAYAGRVLADERKGVTFVGRLAADPLHNRDQAVAQGLRIFDTLPDV